MGAPSASVAGSSAPRASTAASIAPAPVAPPARVFAAVRAEAIGTPRRAPNGDLLAISRDRFFRFHRDGDKLATTIPLQGRSVHLVVAKDRDLAIVTSDEGVARVFEGGRELPKLTIPKRHYAHGISDDGALLHTRGIGASVGRVVEIATGRELPVADADVILSPGTGAFAIVSDGVVSTRDGARVGEVLQRGDARTAAWMGSRAVMLGEAGLVVIDVEKKTTRRVRLSCGTVSDVRDEVDVARKLAIRRCWPATGFGVSVDDLAVKKGIFEAVAAEPLEPPLGIPAPAGRPGQPDLALFVHDHGLEVVGEGGKGQRIGPASDKPFRAPLTTPRAPCPSSELQPHRWFGEGEVLFRWPYGGSCVCDATKCTNPKLDDAVFARSGRVELLTAAQSKTIKARIDGKDAGSHTLSEYVQVSAIADGGAAVILGLAAPRREGMRILELALPDLVPGRAREVPGMDYAHALFATPGHAILVQTGERSVAVTMAPRADGARGPIEIDAWLGGAIARFPDGRFELFGAGAERALACLEEDGTLRELGACRARLEVKGALRIE